MYKNLLVPMALDHGISPQTIEIARTLRSEGGTITALHIFEAPQGTVAAYVDEKIVKDAYQRAKDVMNEKLSGLDDVTGQIIDGHTARAIIEYADTHDIDCIVMGSHKPELSDYLLGSTATRVARHASCAVHIHRTN